MTVGPLVVVRELLATVAFDCVPLEFIASRATPLEGTLICGTLEGGAGRAEIGVALDGGRAIAHDSTGTGWVVVLTMSSPPSSLLELVAGD